MGNFTRLDEISITGIEDILAYPSSGDPFFYGFIFFALWVILTLSTYFEERNRKGEANFLSSAAVSSLGIIVLATIGSLIGIVPGNIFTGVLVIGCIIIAMWFWKGE